LVSSFVSRLAMFSTLTGTLFWGTDVTAAAGDTFHSGRTVIMDNRHKKQINLAFMGLSPYQCLAGTSAGCPFLDQAGLKE